MFHTRQTLFLKNFQIQIIMEELIKKIQEQYGLSEEQTRGVIQTISGYVKERFPMVKGAVDQLFQSGTTPSSPGTTPSEIQSVTNSNPPNLDDILG